MNTVILITTQDKDEGYTLVMFGQKAGKSLGPFGASIQILDSLLWDFFYTGGEYTSIFLIL